MWDSIKLFLKQMFCVRHNWRPLPANFQGEAMQDQCKAMCLKCQQVRYISLYELTNDGWSVWEKISRQLRR